MYSDDFKPENYRYVGKNAAPRKDAKAIVSGKAVFLDDFTLPGMLIGYTLRSPHPHAMIKSIRTEEAKNQNGVLAVLTYEDVDQSWKMGWPPQKPILCPHLRYIGDPVALIAAVDLETAKKPRN